MMVPPISATRRADEQATRPNAELFSSGRVRTFLYSRATTSGKERHTPASGKYTRCSKITSAIGTTLDVGESVIKNHKMEKASTGWRCRSRQARNRKAKRKTIDARTAGSK